MIIIINGSINSGKSTVSKLLVKQLPNTAHIEVDKLREFVDSMPLTPELIEMNILNAALVARTFINHGLDAVISYPLSKKDYSLLIGTINIPEQRVITFTLNPELTSALTNRGARELDYWERERINQHYETGINNPEFESILIDNTHQTPKETVAEMVEHIENLK